MSDIKYFKNNINADLYVGQGAGRKLIQELENAKKSVKIVSPYLSPIYIDKLINLKNKGVEVTLITSDDIEDYKDGYSPRIITKLIRQIRHINEYAQNLRNKKIVQKKWVIISLIISIVINFYLFLQNENNKLIILCSVLLGFAAVVLNNQIKKIRVYSYSYEQLFPFRVFVSPFNKQMRNVSSFFIHSKIYIIDDEVAYLGSLNYSKSGLESNLESRIRIDNSQVVSDLSNLVEDLFHNNDENAYIDIKSWGRTIYNEPIN